MSAEQDLKEAINIIKSFIDGEYCVWASERRRGETCRAFRTRVQGMNCWGCNQCEARSFLKALEEKNK
jgi:hypothetical protein